MLLLPAWHTHFYSKPFRHSCSRTRLMPSYLNRACRQDHIFQLLLSHTVNPGEETLAFTQQMPHSAGAIGHLLPMKNRVGRIHAPGECNSSGRLPHHLDFTPEVGFQQSPEGTPWRQSDIPERVPLLRQNTTPNPTGCCSADDASV